MEITKNRYSVHIFPGKDRHRIFLSEISNVWIRAYHIVRERERERWKHNGGEKQD